MVRTVISLMLVSVVCLSAYGDYPTEIIADGPLAYLMGLWPTSG